MPIEPASTAPSSLRMSPNMFSVSTTSKRLRVQHQLHRAVVHQHVVERRHPETRSPLRSPRGARAANSRARSICPRDVTFLRRVARQVEGHAGNALDFRARVGHGIDRPLFRAVFR